MKLTYGEERLVVSEDTWEPDEWRELHRTSAQQALRFWLGCVAECASSCSLLQIACIPQVPRMRLSVYLYTTKPIHTRNCSTVTALQTATFQTNNVHVLDVSCSINSTCRPNPLLFERRWLGYSVHSIGNDRCR